jgi:hypothetical protein
MELNLNFLTRVFNFVLLNVLVNIMSCRRLLS